MGANVGERTSVFLALGARVVAVEPQPDCARRLRDRFAGSSRLQVVESALGPEPGEAELLTTGYDTLATLSPEWVGRVRETGRFALDWTGRIAVPVTTLDRLIAAHGRPAFCKIDVEGYERQVLEGLTQPLPALSFEFTPEYVEATESCLRLLQGLGLERFALSLGESMELGAWTTADSILAELRALPRGTRVFGDVYATS